MRGASAFVVHDVFDGNLIRCDVFAQTAQLYSPPNATECAIHVHLEHLNVALRMWNHCPLVTIRVKMKAIRILGGSWELSSCKVKSIASSGAWIRSSWSFAVFYPVLVEWRRWRCSTIPFPVCAKEVRLLKTILHIILLATESKFSFSIPFLDYNMSDHDIQFCRFHHPVKADCSLSICCSSSVQKFSLKKQLLLHLVCSHAN